MDDKRSELIKLVKDSFTDNYSDYMHRIRDAEKAYVQKVKLLVNRVQEIINSGMILVVQPTGERYKSFLTRQKLGNIYGKYGIVHDICISWEDDVLLNVYYDFKEKPGGRILVPAYLEPLGELKDIQIFDNEYSAKLFCELNNPL